MYVSFRWLASLSTLVATAHAAIEAVEVDLIFPRNDTYSPSYDFPLVFAVQNAQHAELLNIYLRYQIRWGDFRNNYTYGWTDLLWANWSSADPYFAFDFFNLNRTEYWRLDWQLRWQSCDEKGLGDGLFTHHHAGRQFFKTDDSAPKDVDVDLVATTADATCPNNLNGVMINVTDTIMQLPPNVLRRDRDTCILTVNSTDSTTSTTPDPCRAVMDEKAVASFTAARREKQCDPLLSANPPEDCPAGNGALHSVVRTVSSFWAAFGVLGFVLL
ncbi:hypothetical protein FE257_001018 [Aspergillus nanangensis]|uniref:DUF7136 domain-containing protein n=1 Tax=Aspergillus nanangensis TaxID=2582783 RepID=A0AAD4GX84_ASPNN|nr:hypothetical protein FE257_001018 [Aspergillus nanangensis]